MRVVVTRSIILEPKNENIRWKHSGLRKKKQAKKKPDGSFCYFEAGEMGRTCHHKTPDKWKS